jgi:hypothetical protein
MAKSSTTNWIVYLIAAVLLVLQIVSTSPASCEAETVWCPYLSLVENVALVLVGKGL